MSWKEADKNIQLKAGLDKDRKIRSEKLDKNYSRN